MSKTADSWLAHLVEYPNLERSAAGSIPGQTNTQGLKITEENVLPYADICKWLDSLVFSDKDDKLEVPSHRTFT